MPIGSGVVTVTGRPWRSGGVIVKVIGTDTVRASSTSIPCKIVTLKADDSNAGDVFWGFESELDSATNCFRLDASQSFDVPVSNVNMLYLKASALNQMVTLVWGL